MSKIENATQWALNIANNDDYGYDQNNRWGPDYDCSSMVIQAYENAGVPVKSAGATYTGNMKPVFTANDFSDVTAIVNLSTGRGLQRGDVLLNYSHHTAIYIGNGQLVHASINEHGHAVGGQPGDQTGREICVRGYYNYPWDCVLRFTGDNYDDASPEPQSFNNQLSNVEKGQQESINFTGHQIAVDGIYGPETKKNKIRVLQTALNKDYCGPDALVKNCFDTPLVVDGIWGPKTDGALGNHYIQLGEHQYMVTAMEICAYMGGNDPEGVEYPGIYGQGLRGVLNADFCGANVFRFVFACV